MKKLEGKIEKINISKLKQSERLRYENIVSDITEESGQSVGEYVKNWFSVSEKLLIFREKDKNEAKGFIIFGFFEKDIMFIPALMVAKEYQDKKISSKLTKKAIKISILDNFYKFFIKKRNLFKFYILFRTQNPKLFKIVSKKINVFPSSDPSDFLFLNDKLKNKIKTLVNKLWPQGEFDEISFVLNNAYINTPGLIIKPADVSWSGDKKIDTFMDENLGLSNFSKHSLIVVGEIDLFKILKGK